MKIIPYALTMLLSLVLASPAQEPPPPPEGHGPTISCEEPNFNFGSAESGGSVEHTYVIKNTGDMTLLIGKIKTSCGCTVASVTTKEVPPGEETRVTAKLSLKNRRGRQHKAITVESNDPKTPRISLTLEGDATSILNLQPSRVYFGQLDQEKPASSTVDITAGSDKAVTITGVESQSEHIAAELETVEEGRHYRLRVTTKPPLATGALRGNVRLTTDSTTMPMVNVAVSGTVLDELTIAPAKVVLASSDTGVTRYVVVRPGRTKEFSLEKVEAPLEDIGVNIQPLGANGYQIRLDNLVGSSELDGKKLVITTDVEAKKTIEIPFRVISQP